MFYLVFGGVRHSHAHAHTHTDLKKRSCNRCSLIPTIISSVKAAAFPPENHLYRQLKIYRALHLKKNTNN
uniref:Uncharacterized protein n=1 Tax=Anguilla anguilla TaxID=7936 RepID=A0A0E9WJ00_ANGAN